jgi:kumamolisin
MAEPTRRISLPGSERPRVHGSKLINPLEKDKNISVTFVIRPRPDSPPLPDLAYWQTTPLKNRRYLSTQEYAETYGAAQSDLDIVTAFAETHGMTVLDSHAGKRSVTVQGTTAQMNVAFGIELNSYESPLPPQSRRNTAEGSQSTGTHTHHGFDGAVSLPSELSGIVTAVVGLDNSIRGGHSTPSGDPPGAMLLSVPQIASYYNFPNPADGVSDQTIGIFAGQIFPGYGATYRPQDLSQYFSSPALSGYSKMPNIQDVDLTVGGVGPFKNNPLSYPDIEITQDISIAATVAQGVNINVYFTEQTEQGWLVFLNRILLPPVGETQPNVISSSWYITPSDSPTTTFPVTFGGPFGSVTVCNVVVIPSARSHGN